MHQLCHNCLADMLGRYGPCEMSDLQERMKRSVALLGEEEVKKIMREEGKIEVNLWVSRLAVSGLFALRFACPIASLYMQQPCLCCILSCLC